MTTARTWISGIPPRERPPKGFSSKLPQCEITQALSGPDEFLYLSVAKPYRRSRCSASGNVLVATGFGSGNQASRVSKNEL